MIASWFFALADRHVSAVAVHNSSGGDCCVIMGRTSTEDGEPKSGVLIA